MSADLQYLMTAFNQGTDFDAIEWMDGDCLPQCDIEDEAMMALWRFKEEVYPSRGWLAIGRTSQIRLDHARLLARDQYIAEGVAHALESFPGAIERLVDMARV